MDPRPPLLPHPTADLHLSDFRGSIQDIFESNALKHPEKLCVIETASTFSLSREFTYRQINEASNILAHHLVQSGVKRFMAGAELIGQTRQIRLAWASGADSMGRVQAVLSDGYDIVLLPAAHIFTLQIENVVSFLFV